MNNDTFLSNAFFEMFWSLEHILQILSHGIRRIVTMCSLTFSCLVLLGLPGGLDSTDAEAGGFTTGP